MVVRPRKEKVAMSEASFASDRILFFRYDRTITKGNGRWMAKSPIVGFAAYGRKREDDVFRLHKGITVIVNSLRYRRGLDGVSDLLDSRDISYSFSPVAIANGEGVIRVTAGAQVSH